MRNQQNRSVSVDFVRVAGVVAIVAGHVWENEFTRYAIYSWHVPLFFVLTGFFWTRARPIGEDVRRRSRSLLIPYGVWLVIIAVPFIVVLTVRDSSFPIETVGRIVWGGSAIGRPFSAFWFVTALFFAVLLLRVLQSFPIWIVWGVALLGLLTAYLTEGVLAYLPLSVGVAVPAIVFILCGYCFRLVRSSIRAPLLVSAFLLVGSASLIIFGVSRPLDLKQADFGTPVIGVLVAVAISIGLLLLADSLVRWGGWAADWTIQLAAAAFMVVLSHTVVLWVLDAPLAGSVMDFAAALLVPLGLALTLRRSALSPYLLGVPRAQSQHS